MIESKLKEYRSRSQNKGLTGCRTGNEMNGFCLKQDQGLKGLDGQYIHTPHFSAVIFSLPSPPHVPAFRPSPGRRKARNLIMPYFP